MTNLAVAVPAGVGSGTHPLDQDRHRQPVHQARVFVQNGAMVAGVQGLAASGFVQAGAPP
jgi:hypothetical protein